MWPKILVVSGLLWIGAVVTVSAAEPRKLPALPSPEFRGAAVANVDFPGGMLAEVVKDHLHELRFESLLPLFHPHLAVLIAVIIVREDGFQGEAQVECLFFLKHSGLPVMIDKRSASATVVPIH